MGLADWVVRIGSLGVLNSNIKYEGTYSYETPEERSLITHKQLDQDKPKSAKVSVYMYIPNENSKCGVAIKIQDDNSGLIIKISKQ